MQPSDLLGCSFDAYTIAKEQFPDATDDELNFIIWEFTGYPSFWQIGVDGATPEECFRNQLARVRKS